MAIADSALQEKYPIVMKRASLEGGIEMKFDVRVKKEKDGGGGGKRERQKPLLQRWERWGLWCLN